MNIARFEPQTFIARWRGGHEVADLNLLKVGNQTVDEKLSRIRTNVLSIGPRQAERSVLDFLGATEPPVGTPCFSVGLHRAEDGFILDGLMPYFKRAAEGEKISILEVGAGSTWPHESFWAVNSDGFTFQSRRHFGRPWLSRLLGSQLAGVTNNISFTISDGYATLNHAVTDRVMLKDENGALHFVHVFRKRDFGKDQILDNPTQICRKVPAYKDDSPNWRPWTEVESELLQFGDYLVFTGGKSKLAFDPARSVAIAFPEVDRTFEAMYNLSVSHVAFDSPSNSLNPNDATFDFIFGRHLPPYYDSWFNRILEGDDLRIDTTMRQLLKPGGEARLCFDQPLSIPGKTLKTIQHDKTTRGRVVFPDGWGSY